MTKVYHHFIFPLSCLAALCLRYMAHSLTHSLTRMPSPSIPQATVSASAAATNLPNISTPESLGPRTERRTHDDLIHPSIHPSID
ncbi:hypothetical protein IWX48DRAFT_630154 [Phyllosticta citricarpa]